MACLPTRRVRCVNAMRVRTDSINCEMDRLNSQQMSNNAQPWLILYNSLSVFTHSPPPIKKTRVPSIAEPAFVSPSKRRHHHMIFVKSGLWDDVCIRWFDVRPVFRGRKSASHPKNPRSSLMQPLTKRHGPAAPTGHPAPPSCQLTSRTLPPRTY